MAKRGGGRRIRLAVGPLANKPENCYILIYTSFSGCSGYFLCSWHSFVFAPCGILSLEVLVKKKGGKKEKQAENLFLFFGLLLYITLLASGGQMAAKLNQKTVTFRPLVTYNRGSWKYIHSSLSAHHFSSFLFCSSTFFSSGSYEEKQSHSRKEPFTTLRGVLQIDPCHRKRHLNIL